MIRNQSESRQEIGSVPSQAKCVAILDLALDAGRATDRSPVRPGRPMSVGPGLGQYGIRVAQFLEEFNRDTRPVMESTVAVKLYIFEDRTYSYTLSWPESREEAEPRGEFGVPLDVIAAPAVRLSTPTADIGRNPRDGKSEDATVVVTSWQMAEALAAWHMRTIGFEGAAVTRAGADGGLDVVSNEAVAQVKHYSTSPIGAPAVQQLRGAANPSTRALFYSLSGFTKSAMAFADSANVALFHYDESGHVRPTNLAAERLEHRRDANTSVTPQKFQLEREATELSEQYIELATKLFMASAEEVLEVGRPWAGTHPITSAVMSETSNLQKLLARVHDTTVSIEDLIEVGQQIIAARNRLIEAAARLGTAPREEGHILDSEVSDLRTASVEEHILDGEAPDPRAAPEEGAERRRWYRRWA
jgi:hypothetical protein